MAAMPGGLYFPDPALYPTLDEWHNAVIDYLIGEDEAYNGMTPAQVSLLESVEEDNEYDKILSRSG